MPELQQLDNPKTNLATQILSSDGVVLGKFYFNDNRTPIIFDTLPDNLVQALIATEDERFFSHSGIDLKGTLRALVYLGKKGGASTISQQLARQLFVGVRSRNKVEAVLQKFKEWVLAVQLERRYTKEEIIAMYLNIYDFGYSADGIQSAAKIYFNTTPSQLRIEQSATLVGMLKNSSLYNPLRRPDRVEKRRNIVFQQMERNNFISQKELDSLKAIPLKLDYTPDSHREGLATYFRAYLQQFMRKWTSENLKEDGSKYDIFRDGLRIYTTIDSRLQKIGEESVAAHIFKFAERILFTKYS
jgi:penicillin-binding protein 1A